MIADFADSSASGFFYTANHHEDLIARTKDSQDNATPSGNGMAAYALLRLGRLTSQTDLEEHGYATLEAVSGLLAEHPRAAGQSLMALDFHLGPAPEIVILDQADSIAGDEFLAVLRSGFQPNALLIRAVAETRPSKLLAPLLTGKTLMDGKTTAYVCERGACRQPCTDPQSLLSELSATV
jgi:uncharacterized protein YyaL (SSP411 family)